MPNIFLPVLFVLLSLVQLWTCLKEKHELRKPTKVMLMPVLALCYMSFAEEPSELVTAGLLLGSLGDLALLWPLNEKTFLAGVAAFCAGHVCYLINIFGRYTISAGAVWTAVISAVYFAGCIVVFIATKNSMPRAVRIPSFLYMLVLAAVSACTLLVLISGATAGRAVAFAGATLFLCSDGILCQMLFIKKSEPPKVNFLVMLTYILGQAMMAAGWAMA